MNSKNNMYNSDTHEIENLYTPVDVLIDQINRAHKEKNPIKRLLILLGQK